MTEKEQHDISRLLAEKLITIGYSFAGSNKALAKRGYKTLTTAAFCNLMTRIARKVFRALESFLINVCKQKIRNFIKIDDRIGEHLAIQEIIVVLFKQEN